MKNLKPLSLFVFLFALACERIFIKTHCVESRCVTALENTLFAGASFSLEILQSGAWQRQKRCIILNNMRAWFPIERVCSQGDPLPLLNIFLLCADILAIRIHKESGLKINSTKLQVVWLGSQKGSGALDTCVCDAKRSYTQVKDPVVYVRVRWIMKTSK